MKRNTKVGRSLQRYVPKVGDLVYLQNQRTKIWDCAATVQLVRPGSRSAYVVAEDDNQMYLRSHVYKHPRNQAESDTVSSDSDEPELSQQTLAQVMLAQPQEVGNISMAASIVQSDHKRKLPKNLSSAQSALSDTEKRGQSRPERCEKKKVRFFLPCEHVESRSDKRDIICEGYSTESSIPFDCCCRKQTSSHAFCLPTATDDDETLTEGSADHHGHVGGLGFGDGPRREAPLRNQF